MKDLLTVSVAGRDGPAGVNPSPGSPASVSTGNNRMESGMFVATRAVSWAFESSKSQRTARLVLVAIAAHCNDDGYCWPSLSRIATLCGLSKPSVLKCISELVGLGEVTVEQGGRGPKDTNHYYLSAFMISVKKGQENEAKGKVYAPLSVKYSSSEEFTHVVENINDRSEKEGLSENPEESLLEETKELNHIRVPRVKTRWPEGFNLDDKMREFALDHGLIPDQQFEAFRDYHQSKGNRFLDWKAAWRTWCRTALQISQRSKSADSRSKHEQRTTRILEAYRRQEKRDNQEVGSEMRRALPNRSK